jgi:hypothetical protein
VAATPAKLVGGFVVEVGSRQAWPFVGFCDNAPTPPVETRLYIDTDYEVVGVDGLPALMGLTVSSAGVGPGESLAIVFAEGAKLVISGDANATTTGDVWWLGRS